MMRTLVLICMAVAITGWCQEQTFKGTVINVTYHSGPGVVWKEGTKINAVTGRPTTGVGKPSGWIVEMYDIIAEKLGLEFNIRPARSEGIANVSSSTFTSTTYDVGQSINDMAIGSFWETPQRRSYSDVRACMCARVHASMCICSSSRLLQWRVFAFSVEFNRRPLNGTR